MLHRQAELAADAPVTFPLLIGIDLLPIKQVGASIHPLLQSIRRAAGGLRRPTGL